MARRNSPLFLALLFCLLQSSDLALRALTKEKMLHSIFPSLLLWGMCKMRSSQYHMRSIPNSLCGLRADLGLTIHRVLSRSTEKRIQEASAHHISWAFAISSSCRLGEKREDLDACLWLPPPWTLWGAWCHPAESRFCHCWLPPSLWPAPAVGEVAMQRRRHVPADIAAFLIGRSTKTVSW